MTFIYDFPFQGLYTNIELVFNGSSIPRDGNMLPHDFFVSTIFVFINQHLCTAPHVILMASRDRGGGSFPILDLMCTTAYFVCGLMKHEKVLEPRAILF